MTKLFVYGTLKRGYWWNKLLYSSKFLYETTLEGFDLAETNTYAANYPILTYGMFKIKGEVYEVSPENYATIHNMEKGAGYETKVVNGLTLFVMPNAKLKLMLDRKVAIMLNPVNNIFDWHSKQTKRKAIL
jgi:gamma-glutamylcyclotransferase (GGCT)/AIG2-like uncharacterized protein YtfP